MKNSKSARPRYAHGLNRLSGCCGAYRIFTHAASRVARISGLAGIAFLATVSESTLFADATGDPPGQLRLGERLLEFAGSAGQTYVDTNLDSGDIVFPVSFSLWGYWFDDGGDRIKIWGWYDDMAGRNRGELEMRRAEDALVLLWYAGESVRTARPPANEWVHYGVVMAEDETRLYVNGRQVGAAASHSIDTGRTLWIGARPNRQMHEDSFAGRLRDWIVFAGDIGDEGMRRIADGDGLPPVEITQHLPLNEGHGSVVRDRSGNGVHGTVEGAVWTTDIPALVAKGERATIELQRIDTSGNPMPGAGLDDIVSASGGTLDPSVVRLESGAHAAEFRWSHDEAGTFSIVASHPDLNGDELEIRVGIVAALQDGDPGAGEQALQAIQRITVESFAAKLERDEYEPAISALFSILEGDDEALQSRAQVAVVGLLAALEESGDEAAVEALRMALRDGPRASVRGRAARALGALQDTKSIDELTGAMDAGDAGLRVSAAHALKAMGEPVELAFSSPYAGVDWGGIGYHDANLHTHTNFSDGSYDPHYAIDTYRDMDYDILALTDHDSLHVDVWPRALYPWTELNEIYHHIKDEMSVRFGATYAEVADEEWQNRDPDELGMVSIPGSEISRTHHIGSLFNHYAGGTEDEETAFLEIGERGGLAMFNHPGRYDRERAWYVDFFRRHAHVVGMEIYNQVDRYPVDRRRWDAILYELMPDRPVWGFANDDTHTDNHFGRNRNIFLLPGFSLDHVFEAMQRGHFYLFVPVEQGTPPPVKLTGAAVDGQTIRLEVDGDYTRVEWMTHNPDTDDNHSVGSGLEISMEDLTPPATFVRAVIISDAGRTYTQPFGVHATRRDRE